jgi:hypothetical protein
MSFPASSVRLIGMCFSYSRCKYALRARGDSLGMFYRYAQNV